MARSLETAEEAAFQAKQPPSGLSPASSGGGDREEDRLAAVRRNAANLRALIVKTADEAAEIAAELGATRQELESSYLARSDFGEYMEQAKADFVTTARGVVESYDFAALIGALSGRTEELDSYLTAVRGEIRRGVITDPDSGETAFGIAISEKLRFTGSVCEQDGLRYYELAPGQTLGLYTATGWQFWVNGSKRGWFDSRDGRLHVVSEVVENGLQLGADWALSAVGGLGIRYVGG